MTSKARRRRRTGGAHLMPSAAPLSRSRFRHTSDNPQRPQRPLDRCYEIAPIVSDCDCLCSDIAPILFRQQLRVGDARHQGHGPFGQKSVQGGVAARLPGLRAASFSSLPPAPCEPACARSGVAGVDGVWRRSRTIAGTVHEAGRRSQRCRQAAVKRIHTSPQVVTLINSPPE